MEEVIDFVEMGVYFDEEVRSSAIVGERFISIYYQQGKRPVQIELISGEQVKIFVAELQEQIYEFASDDTDLQRRIEQTTHLYLFEICALALDEAWDMSAALQAFMCQSMNGIVGASEGIYDEKLQMILEFKRS